MVSLGGMSANMNGEPRKITVFIVVGIAILIVLVLIVASIGAWFFFNGLGFWIEVEFKNEGSEEVWITPIGYNENWRQIGPLAVIYQATPFQDSPQNTRFHLLPNESTVIKYDWDDQNLQFIMVEDTLGTTYIIPLDESKWNNSTICQCCCPPDATFYSIPNCILLEVAPDWLLPTIQGEFVSIPADW